MGLTLSKEQLGEAAARVKAAGLEDKVSFQFCDYRDFKCGEHGTLQVACFGHQYTQPALEPSMQRLS